MVDNIESSPDNTTLSDINQTDFSLSGGVHFPEDMDHPYRFIPAYRSLEQASPPVLRSNFSIRFTAQDIGNLPSNLVEILRNWNKAISKK